MTALTDALDHADREIDYAKASLDGAKWLMIALERAPEADRPEVRRKLLTELDWAARAATAASKHVERPGKGLLARRAMTGRTPRPFPGRWHAGSNLILGALGGSALSGEFGSAGTLVGALVGAAFGLWLAFKGRARHGEL